MSPRTTLVVAMTLCAAGTASGRKLQHWRKPDIPAMQKACAAGKLKVCVALGGYMMTGSWGAPPDLAKAGELERKACDGGEPAGCAGLARQLSFHSSELAPALAELLDRGCARGSASGCYWLGRWAKEGQRKLDLMASAYELYTTACNAGDPEACHDAGTMNRDSHEDGYEQAVSWDERLTAKLDADACSAGFAESCSCLGRLYEEGRGLGQNDRKARDLYDKGCKLGDSDGCKWSHELIEKRAALGIRF
jgi:TPR repeat protein